MEDKLLRLKDVLKIIPISKAAWWDGVKSGKFPQSVKLGVRTTCWRYSDVMELVKNINS